MITGAMLPGMSMGLSLLHAGYAAGVKNAYAKYEQKHIGHLKVTELDSDIDGYELSSIDDDSTNGFVEISDISIAEDMHNVELAGIDLSL